MQIRTLKKVEYEGCPVYIRNFGDVFEYITVINGEVYTAHIVARKSVLKRILFMDYSADDLHKVMNYMIAMAQTTIDTILGIKHDEKKP